MTTPPPVKQSLTTPPPDLQRIAAELARVSVLDRERRILEALMAERERADDRVTFQDGSTLDEVVSSRGAHLEYMGENSWFLIFCHADGTESAFWFKSRDLRRPFWETRENRERTRIGACVPARPTGPR